MGLFKLVLVFAHFIFSLSLPEPYSRRRLGRLHAQREKARLALKQAEARPSRTAAPLLWLLQSAKWAPAEGSSRAETNAPWLPKKEAMPLPRISQTSPPPPRSSAAARKASKAQSETRKRAVQQKRTSAAPATTTGVLGSGSASQRAAGAAVRRAAAPVPSSESRLPASQSERLAWPLLPPAIALSKPILRPAARRAGLSARQSNPLPSAKRIRDAVASSTAAGRRASAGGCIWGIATAIREGECATGPFKTFNFYDAAFLDSEERHAMALRPGSLAACLLRGMRARRGGASSSSSPRSQAQRYRARRHCNGSLASGCRRNRSLCNRFCRCGVGRISRRYARNGRCAQKHTASSVHQSGTREFA